ncbi:MAG TPA: TrmJ/YjtD family RNA methyltransferase [Bryobacteraceae bacterium]|nr:TrmJ/YjtD family RNA methyltransferase [Bryobacteraceae bacterium]
MSDIRVVLVSPRNPLNIGAVARAMSNFGFTSMRLVNPYDVAFREARSAVHSHYVLEQAEIYDSLPAAVADCGLVIGTTAVGNRDLTVPLYSVEAAAGLLQEQGSAAPAALLFGSEKFGLSNEDLSNCNFVLRIPSREEHGSINLGQAVAICLYEMRRSAERESLRFPPAETATAGDQERFTESLLEILRNSGYINERTAESTEQKLRRLVRRLRIPAGDIETWLGVLRQILWKSRQ